jgi:outer membrane lipoprotein carrier protein
VSDPRGSATGVLWLGVRSWFAYVLLVVAGGTFAGAQGGAGSPAELAQALQTKYDGIRDFSTDFVHTYRGGVLRRQLTEHGRLLVKKPGKMRWEYTKPEHKVFVSDGSRLYSYIPEDRQVIVSRMPGEDSATTPALFLAGKGSLTRDFTASFAETPEGLPEGTRALKLVPTTPQTDYDWLVVGADPKTLALRGLVAVDAQGGTSTFVFSNMKENAGLADKLFVFSIPRGVDVVTDSSAR